VRTGGGGRLDLEQLEALARARADVADDRAGSGALGRAAHGLFGTAIPRWTAGSEMIASNQRFTFG